MPPQNLDNPSTNPPMPALLPNMPTFPTGQPMYQLGNLSEGYYYSPPYAPPTSMQDASAGIIHAFTERLQAETYSQYGCLTEGNRLIVKKHRHRNHGEGPLRGGHNRGRVRGSAFAGGSRMPSYRLHRDRKAAAKSAKLKAEKSPDSLPKPPIHGPDPSGIKEASGKRLPTPDSGLKHSMNKLTLGHLSNSHSGTTCAAIKAATGPSASIPVDNSHANTPILDHDTVMSTATAADNSMLAVDHTTFRDGAQEGEMSDRDAKGELDNSHA
ncbi:hypothetical protein P691DRAFT_760764 [Macrolepiota fuliginosa MF-IS2]|uniref:Uncharacterized protein n=1 Tax=Macrolepiota fuliginosa MF-IS2 TaxID=1400762 RepID=A0A9P5X9Q8_9AGAR|nr:hypothetical protein P691DRAFT_760764 [Macrolepiota fuliginosa MF-IS2]